MKGSLYVKNVPKAIERFGTRDLKLIKIFPKLSRNEKKRIRKLEIYKKLVEFGKIHADFVSTLSERNGETHPNFISVD